MLKITDKQKKEALEIGRKHKAAAIYVNDKGEYFSDENLCKTSVGGDKELYGKVEITSEVKETTATNDLGKAEDVLAAIESATEKEAVEAILTAEKAGKNRVTVVKVAEAKLEMFNAQ